MTELITLTSIILIAYHHIVYPRWLTLLARRASASPEAKAGTPSEYADIIIFIPAFNEEKYIAEKIRNLACLDYPKERLKVVMAFDGCTDDTLTIATHARMEPICRDLSIQFRVFKKNRGKMAILNDIAPSLQCDILVFSNVSSLASLDCLKILSERFSNPSVGAVNGNYRLLKSGGTDKVICRRHQRPIKIAEDFIGSAVGAHGALYAVKWKLFRPPPQDCTNDEFVIPMHVVEDGYNAVFEPRLNAVKIETCTRKQDWAHKTHAWLSSVQQLLILRRLMHPKFSGIAFHFLSGKGLRVLMPILMIIAFVGSWASSGTFVFLTLAVAQSVVYLIASTYLFLSEDKQSRHAGTPNDLGTEHLASPLSLFRHAYRKGKSVARRPRLFCNLQILRPKNFVFRKLQSIGKKFTSLY